MNRLLYVTLNELNPAAGVSKKILDQVNAFKNNGVNTNLLAVVNKSGKRMAMINDFQLDEIDHGLKGQIQIIGFYDKIINYIDANFIDSLYVRYTQNADPFYLNFLKRAKQRGCKILLEIPTYPYEGEFSGQSLILKIQILVERTFRKSLKNYVDYIVTTSDFDSILGINTIRISNAANASNIPIVRKVPKTGELVLISVATISFWHGLDRIILGLEQYYSNLPSKIVRLIIVGGGDPVTIKLIRELINRTKLQQYIQYVGPKYGDELDQYYNQADLAVGCLACHRKNIIEVKSLKNVDYAMRGLPMFYSEKNSDFDDMPYVYNVPADETPIDICSLIKFHENLNLSAIDIRNSVAHFTWDEQIRKIIKSI